MEVADVETTTSANISSLLSSQEQNDTDYDLDELEALLPGIVHLVIWYILILLIAALMAFITCLIAIFSWILIPKWRTFKNYVFLNLIACYTASYSFYFVEGTDDKDDIFSIIVYFFINAFVCWLFIASVITYMAIVKVFKVTVTRKVLKCNIFAWGVPLVKFVFDAIDLFWINFSVYLPSNNYILAVLLLLLNFIVYLRVLYTLLRSKSMSKTSQKAQVATVTFLMSGSLVLPSIALNLFGRSIYTEFVASVLPLLQTIAISICFLMLKSNRTMWREHCSCCKKCCCCCCDA